MKSCTWRNVIDQGYWLSSVDFFKLKEKKSFWNTARVKKKIVGPDLGSNCSCELKGKSTTLMPPSTGLSNNSVFWGAQYCLRNRFEKNINTILMYRKKFR